MQPKYPKESKQILTIVEMLLKNIMNKNKYYLMRKIGQKN